MQRFECARRAIAVLASTPIGLCASGILHGSAEADTLRTRDQFVRHALPSTMHLHDLGVADINDGGWLDIYTTNHQFRPLILTNQLDGKFSNDVLRLHLGTAQDYTGGDPTFNKSKPTFDRSGLYIYWHLGELIVRAHRIPKSTPASGTILVGPNEISETDGPVMIEQHPTDAAILPESKTIAFVMSESSTIKIKSFRRYYYSRSSRSVVSCLSM
jgi:hypothetical protein